MSVIRQMTCPSSESVKICHAIMTNTVTLSHSSSSINSVSGHGFAGTGDPKGALRMIKRVSKLVSTLGYMAMCLRYNAQSSQ